MQTARLVVTPLIVASAAFWLVGCATPTVTYKKPLTIPRQSTHARNPSPVPTSLAVMPPTVQGEHIISQVNGQPTLFIRVDKGELAENFRSSLYQALLSSGLYENTILQNQPEPNGHAVEATITLPSVNANGWTVWADFTTEVPVDYRVRSATGSILKSGRVSIGGHFDQGHGGFSMQEKMRFQVEPVLESLGKSAAQLPEVLLGDPRYLSQARMNQQAPPSEPSLSSAPLVGNTAPEPNNPASTRLRQRWAVCVGVSQYRSSRDGGFDGLPFASQDASEFGEWLVSTGGWPRDHVTCLLDGEATERQVRIALESWLTKARAEDLIVLFWAGHGYPDPEDPEKVYFACHDTDPNIPATGFRMDRVVQILKERAARNVIVLADTCHAGKLVTRGERGLSVIPTVKKMQEQDGIPKGWVFMVSAEADRKAVEHSSWRNGAFTHCFLQGLGGKADGFQSAGRKDGTVTLGELRAYLTTAMPDETQKVLGVAKHPLITTSSGDPDIWNLTLQAESTAPSKAAPSAPSEVR